MHVIGTYTQELLSVCVLIPVAAVVAPRRDDRVPPVKGGQPVTVLERKRQRGNHHKSSRVRPEILIYVLITIV